MDRKVDLVHLAQAQRETAKNWIKEYRKYFLTEVPVSSEALFQGEN
jgi:hypothetical protein